MEQMKNQKDKTRQSVSSFTKRAALWIENVFDDAEEQSRTTSKQMKRKQNIVTAIAITSAAVIAILIHLLS